MGMLLAGQLLFISTIMNTQKFFSSTENTMLPATSQPAEHIHTSLWHQLFEQVLSTPEQYCLGAVGIRPPSTACVLMQL